MPQIAVSQSLPLPRDCPRYVRSAFFLPGSGRSAASATTGMATRSTIFTGAGLSCWINEPLVTAHLVSYTHANLSFPSRPIAARNRAGKGREIAMAHFSHERLGLLRDAERSDDLARSQVRRAFRLMERAAAKGVSVSV